MQAQPSEAYRIVGILLSDLGERGLLRERPAVPQRSQRIFQRLHDTNAAFASVRRIHADPDECRRFINALSGLLDESCWYDMIHNLLFYYIIQSYEFITTSLTGILDDGKLCLKKPPMMSDILSELEDCAGCKEFGSMLNNRLRNALAHGTYWFEKHPAGPRLVYDGVPDGGLSLPALIGEFNQIYDVILALRAWHGDMSPDRPARVLAGLSRSGRAFLTGDPAAAHGARMAGIYRVVGRLMDGLAKNGMLREEPADTPELRGILSRFCRMTSVMLSFRTVYHDPRKGAELRRRTSRWLSVDDWDEIMYNLTLYHLVQSYELTGTILAWVLGMAGSGTRRLPKISKMLENAGPGRGEFEALLNEDLRNALAHGDYWVDDGADGWHLVYEDAPRGGLGIRDVAAEHYRIHGALSALRSWYDGWLARGQPSQGGPDGPGSGRVDPGSAPADCRVYGTTG